MGAGRDNRSLVDQRHLPSAELAGAGDRVVDVGQRDAWDSARDKILVVVGQYDLAAALKRDAMLNELQIGRRFQPSSSAMVPVLLMMPLSGSMAPSPMVIIPALFVTGV